MSGYEIQGVAINDVSILDRIVKFGRSLCSKETIDIEGTTYAIKEKHGEG